MSEYTETLVGHVNAETAFTVDDYPYGFRLRTKIRYWIETKKGHGQRFVSQTLNPKNGKWNTPKFGTYAPLLVLVRNPENGYVTTEEIRPGFVTKERLAEFEKERSAAFGDYERGVMRQVRLLLQIEQAKRERNEVQKITVYEFP